MKSVTIFKSPRWWEEEQRYVYDNKTHRRMDFPTWEAFVGFLQMLSTRPLKGKQNAELISPAIYEPGTKRSNKNVLAWAGWAAVDVDGWQRDGDPIKVLGAKLKHWDHCIYSTASSREDNIKFRIVFNLSRPVQADEIRRFWFAIQSVVDDQGDKQCKDLSRMYYVPAKYSDANNFFIINEGHPVDVDKLLADFPSEPLRSAANFIDRLPEAWQEMVIEHRKTGLDNTSYTWTSYRDCPFISKRMLDDWFAIAGQDGSGRYRKVYAMMVAIATKAIKKKYPITADQLVQLILQIDADSTRKYQNRLLEVEANNALAYAYKHAM